MAELVADCPRCGTRQITFDVPTAHLIGRKYEWQRWFEVFCICRKCLGTSIFVLSQQHAKEELTAAQIPDVSVALNNYLRVERFISLRDEASVSPPEHVPAPIESVFREGATCLAVECYNAAGTMFRLCVDLATRAMLPGR